MGKTRAQCEEWDFFNPKWCRPRIEPESCVSDSQPEGSRGKLVATRRGVSPTAGFVTSPINSSTAHRTALPDQNPASLGSVIPSFARSKPIAAC